MCCRTLRYSSSTVVRCVSSTDVPRRAGTGRQYDQPHHNAHCGSLSAPIRTPHTLHPQRPSGDTLICCPPSSQSTPQTYGPYYTHTSQFWGVGPSTLTPTHPSKAAHLGRPAPFDALNPTLGSSTVSCTSVTLSITLVILQTYLSYCITLFNNFAPHPPGLR